MNNNNNRRNNLGGGNSGHFDRNNYGGTISRNVNPVRSSLLLHTLVFYQFNNFKISGMPVTTTIITILTT